MLNFLYNFIFIPISEIILIFLSFFNTKISEKKIDTWKLLNLYSPKYNKRIWFHSASMGEFEQAKPIIEYIKKKEPETEIIVTFFSPSGYKNQKNYQYADFICYLPWDSNYNVHKFINIIQPSIAIFIRYEIWLNYLKVLKQKEIKRVLITATIPSSQISKRGALANYYYRYAFAQFNQIWTIGQKHSEYFHSLNLLNEIVTFYDTRKDRIANAVDESIKFPILDKQKFKIPVLVAGSTWNVDEDLLIESLEYLKQKSIHIICIFVPHEPNDFHIKQLTEKIPNHLLLSYILKNPESYHTFDQHIIVDSIGKLLKLYALADFAYVGGAFGAGLHSILEPAGYGIPTFCGENTKSQPDAIEMKKIGALYTVGNDPKELAEAIEMLIKDAEKLKISKEAAFDFIHTAKGSAEILSERILSEIN